MFYSREELQSRAEAYCQAHGLKVERELGHGMQGMVFSTSSATRESAIKVHAAQAAYIRERDAYLRLQENHVAVIRGLSVPELRGFDDTGLIIEMSLVRPPFIVDFGGAYLDAPAPHTTDPDAHESWIADKAEQFGHTWPRVTEILTNLETLYGIFLADVNPGNIQFG